jgi:NADPH:quinone reductase-like Zn-dependent oxidoreductase
MGTRAELEATLHLVQNTGLRPLVDRVLPLTEAASGLAAMAAGDLFGKIVLQP